LVGRNAEYKQQFVVAHHQFLESHHLLLFITYTLTFLLFLRAAVASEYQTWFDSLPLSSALLPSANNAMWSKALSTLGQLVARRIRGWLSEGP